MKRTREFERLHKVVKDKLGKDGEAAIVLEKDQFWLGLGLALGTDIVLFSASRVLYLQNAVRFMERTQSTANKVQRHARKKICTRAPRNPLLSCTNPFYVVL